MIGPQGARWPVRVAGAVAVALGLGALAGCASLSEDQCRRGDWMGIGQRDGAAGAGPERLAAHAKACQKVGVEPDEAQWRRGWLAGLERYCTGPNGRDVGARGSSYGGVCTGGAEVEFLRGYEIGRQIHNLQGVLQGNRAERQRLIDRLAAAGVTDDEKRSLRQRLFQLDRDEDRLRRSIENAWRLPL
ncbi:MAG: DUF2799 domain-containing protein [Ideonella sp.]|nr:DUF2799 domain-containing protein [Ideonella sp.]